MSPSKLDELFDDPANRVWGVFYHCAADPRVVAPSRPNWRGFQINFAHPRAIQVLFLYLVVLLGPVSLTLAFGPGSALQRMALAGLVLAISAGSLVVVSARLARAPAA